MADRYDFNAHRLYLTADLASGAVVACSGEQANYLVNVLRLGDGDGLLVFNGRDGEWRARRRAARAARRSLSRSWTKSGRSSPAPTCTTCLRR